MSSMFSPCTLHYLGLVSCCSLVCFGTALWTACSLVCFGNYHLKDLLSCVDDAFLSFVSCADAHDTCQLQRCTHTKRNQFPKLLHVLICAAQLLQFAFFCRLCLKRGTKISVLPQMTTKFEFWFLWSKQKPTCKSGLVTYPVKMCNGTGV